MTKKSKREIAASAPQTEAKDTGDEVSREGPKVTAKRHFRTRMREDVVVAFLHVEGLNRATRKLTASAWDAEFEAFAAAPR